MRPLLLFLITALALTSLLCDRRALNDEVIATADSPDTKDPPAADRGIYVFIGGKNDGDFTTNYASGRNGADSRCTHAIDTCYPFISLSTARGMISFKNDSLRDVVLPEYAGYPVYGITQDAVETLISESWTDLLADGPLVSLEAAAGLSDIWWTGSDSTGNAVAKRCDGTEGNTGPGWDVNDPAPPKFGSVGSNSGPGAEWIAYSSSTNCNTAHFFLCVAY